MTLILGVNTLYRLFCFFKLFSMVCKGLNFTSASVFQGAVTEVTEEVTWDRVFTPGNITMRIGTEEQVCLVKQVLLSIITQYLTVYGIYVQNRFVKSNECLCL